MAISKKPRKKNKKTTERSSRVELISKLRSRLKESERKYRELVEGATDIIYEVDEKGKFIFVNKGAEKITGYSRRQILKMHFWDIVAPENKDSVSLEHIGLIKSGAKTAYKEIAILTKDKRIVWIGQNIRLYYRKKWLTKAYVVARDITLLKEAEQKRINEYILLRTIIDNIPLNIYVKDLQLKKILANRAECDYLGVTSEKEALGKTDFDFYPEESAQISQAEDLEVLKGKPMFTEETLNTKKGGKQTWFLVSKVPLRNQRNEVVGVTGISIDITERKKTQQKLEEGERLYRLISENSLDVISIHDLEGTFLFVSPSSINLHGYKPEELVGKNGKDFVPKEDYDEERYEAFLKAIRNRRQQTVQFKIRNKKGEAIWVENLAKPIIENDRVVGFQSSVRDISNWKNAEEELRKSEGLFRLLSENSTDIICLHEANELATYKYVSPSIKTILGYEPTDLIGTSPFALHHPEDAARIKGGTNLRTIHGTPVENVEFRMKRKDGEYIWMEAWTKPFFDKTGKVVSFETSTRDISLRKRIEEQLLKAKEDAEAATKVKSEFLSVMSHEIRTPLNGVIGLTQLLMNGSPRVDQLEKLKLLQFSANNLLSLLNDILDFNKIEAGKLTLESISFNLNELLLHTVKMFEPNANEKHILLDLHIGENVRQLVKGDPVRISQVLTNLISNAIKFTDKGSVTVSLEQNNSGDYIFSVQDTGIGIPEDRLHAIFESFTQAEERTTRKYGGSGLGLTISRQLVEMMHGTLRVTSRMGVGSTFSFSLPLPAGDSAAISLGIDLAANIGGRVLLAEDDGVSQAIAQQFLKDWGFEVTAVSNGIDAVKLIASFKFELILIDIHMPGKSGFEIINEVRKMEGPYFKNLPLIIMTASSVADVKSEAMRAGATDVIGKPFEADQLRSVISFHLRSKGQPKLLKPLFEDEIFKTGTVEFKSTLIDLMVGNVIELREKLNSGDPSWYWSIIHKSKTALKYLNNDELNNFLAEVQKSNGEIIAIKKLQRFNEIAEEMILLLKSRKREFI